MNNSHNDEQLFIPEALYAMMMQVEAARVECSRMQAEMRQGRADDFINSYEQQPALPAVAVDRAIKTEGAVIYAAHRFMRRATNYAHAYLAFFIALV